MAGSLGGATASPARAAALLTKQVRYRTAPRQSPPYPGRRPCLTFLRPANGGGPGFLTSWLPVPATTPRAAFPPAFRRGATRSKRGEVSWAILVSPRYHFGITPSVAGRDTCSAVTCPDPSGGGGSLRPANGGGPASWGPLGATFGSPLPSVGVIPAGGGGGHPCGCQILT